MVPDVQIDKLRQSSLPVNLSYSSLRRRRDGDGNEDRDKVSKTPPSTVHLPYSRPMPPTPHRMAALNSLFREDYISRPVSVNASSRSSSITAIPCPVSGTTRQATPTKFCAPTPPEQTCTIEPLLSPTYARRSAQVAGKPPSSFRQHPMLFSQNIDADSSSRYLTRKLDEGSTNHRLAHSVGDGAPSTQAAPVQDDRSSLILKATTLSSSEFHTRNITPHRLMQPIHPPLPRSHTLTSGSYLASQALLSPTRSTHQLSFSRRFNRVETSKNLGLDTHHSDQSRDENVHYSSKHTVHALSTDDIQTAKQISACSIDQQMSPEDVEEGHIRCETENSTINLSINDIANTARLGHQRQRSPQAKPLFVNTILPNSPGGSVDYDSSIPRSAADYSTETVSDTTNSGRDIRDVYTAEDEAYWTGRFVTTCDKLRQVDCTALMKGDENTKPLSINSAAFEESYNCLEASRTTRALQILSKHCRTKVAMKGLADFESRLLQVPKSTPTLPRSASDDFWKQNSTARTSLLSGGFKPDDLAVFKSSSKPCSTSTSSVSAVNAQATFSRLSNLMGRPGLVKSKTTSNIAKLPARVTTRSTSKVTDTPLDPSTKIRRPQDHLRRFSNLSVSFTNSNETNLTASRNMHQDSRTFQSMSVIDCRDNRTEHSAGEVAVRRLKEGTRGKSLCLVPEVVPISTDSQNEDALNLRRPADHDLTALPAGKDRRKQHFAEIINTQKAPRAVTRMTRSGSGEIIKKMVDASAREVRKISRRVGSMGWGSSHEDLTVSGKR